MTRLTHSTILLASAMCLSLGLAGCEADAHADGESPLEADLEGAARSANLAAADNDGKKDTSKVIRRTQIVLGTADDFNAEYGDGKLSDNPALRAAQLLEFNIGSMLDRAKKDTDFAKINCLNKALAALATLKATAQDLVTNGDPYNQLDGTKKSIEKLAKKVNTQCLSDAARFYVGKTNVETVLTEDVIIMQDVDPSNPTGLDAPAGLDVYVIPPPASGAQ